MKANKIVVLFLGILFFYSCSMQNDKIDANENTVENENIYFEENYKAFYRSGKIRYEVLNYGIETKHFEDTILNEINIWQGLKYTVRFNYPNGNIRKIENYEFGYKNNLFVYYNNKSQIKKYEYWYYNNLIFERVPR